MGRDKILSAAHFWFIQPTVTPPIVSAIRWRSNIHPRQMPFFCSPVRLAWNIQPELQAFMTETVASFALLL